MENTQESSRVPYNRAMRTCEFCRRKDVDAINRDLVLHNMSAPQVVVKYQLFSLTRSENTAARMLNNHRKHITRKMAVAQERRDQQAAERLLDDTESLWQECRSFLEVSKEAVTTKAITEGEGKHARTVYKEYRDLGATATAIRVAHENRRLYGDATGAIRPAAQQPANGIVLTVVIPGSGHDRLSRPVLTTGQIVDVEPEESS